MRKWWRARWDSNPTGRILGTPLHLSDNNNIMWWTNSNNVNIAIACCPALSFLISLLVWEYGNEVVRDYWRCEMSRVWHFLDRPIWLRLNQALRMRERSQSHGGHERQTLHHTSYSSIWILNDLPKLRSFSPKSDKRYAKLEGSWGRGSTRKACLLRVLAWASKPNQKGHPEKVFTEGLNGNIQDNTKF